ncbi:NAD-dependent epimerase/dehydratase family protein [Streptomyces sp. INA 01156]
MCRSGRVPHPRRAGRARTRPDQRPADRHQRRARAIGLTFERRPVHRLLGRRCVRGLGARAVHRVLPSRAQEPLRRGQLATEEEAKALSRRWRLPTVSGRITNLYGPGQNLGKNQGLVSAIVKAQLTGEPLPLRAAPETTRDYIYARDCAG